MHNALVRLGISPAGFIDSNPEIQGHSVMGLPVLPPHEVLSRKKGEFYIIICSFFFAEEISASCRAAGLVAEEDFVTGSALQRVSFYNVDVSGSCNLRCPGCAHGAWPRKRTAGFMSVGLYEQILDKILTEDPFAGMVYLYSWGEPLLHPQLPEIIRLTNERLLQPSVSSNLNHAPDLEAVIRAKPAYFRVSTSGYGKNYEETHAGGRWPVVLKNLYRLKDLRERFHPEMEVEVNFHIYKDREEDYRNMQALCADLGFVLRGVLGRIFPMDSVARLLRGEKLSDGSSKILSMQAFPFDEAMEIIREQAGMECSIESILEIAWDGRVTFCPRWFDRDIPNLADSFIDTPLEAILARRVGSAFCMECKKMGIHRWCNVFGDERLTENFKANAIKNAPQQHICDTSCFTS